MSDVDAGSSPAPTAAAPSSTPASPVSTGAPASVSATPQGDPKGSAAPVPNEPGPVPYARFKEVNDKWNAAQDVQKKYEQLKWAESFHQDPYTFVDSWVDQLAAHPQYQAQILAKAARMLQSRRGQMVPQQPQATPEEPQPDVPIVDGNGNVTGQTYSAKQLKAWRDWDWVQKQSTLDQRLQPLESMKQQIEQQQARAEIQQQSNAYATDRLTKYRERWPWFKEHEPQIKAYFAQHEEYHDNLAEAAQDYFAEHVLPELNQTTERKVLADLKTQANGGSVRPDGTGAGLPDFKKMKPADVLRFMHEHPDIADQFANR